MDSTPTPHSDPLRFGAFVIDPQQARVLLHGEPIKLRRKARLVLNLLALNQGRLLPTAEILGAVWPDVTVTPHVLTDIVSTLRRVLALDRSADCRIENERGTGYRLVVEGDGAEKARANAPSIDESEAACIGREDELAELERHWQAALAGHTRVVLLGGAAGIGKSALVTSFCSEAARRSAAATLTGRCHDGLGEAEPYQPFFQAFDGMEAHWGRDVLAATVRRCAPTWLAQLPWLASPEELDAVRRSVAGSHPARLHRETVALLRSLSGHQPILLVIEDLHWADTSTLHLIDALATNGDGARVMVVGTYRSLETELRDDAATASLAELQRRLSLLPEATEIPLRPWPPGVAGSYARRRLRGDIAPELEAAIEKQCGGIPLIAKGLLDSLIGDDALQWRDGRCELANGTALDWVQLPGEVQAMLQSQWRILPPATRALLQAAAASGDTFSAADVAHIADAEEETTRDRLEELCDRGCFLERAEGLLDLGDYAFQHASFRRTAIDALSPARARRLFRRAAEISAATELHDAEIAARFAAGHAWEHAAHHWETAAGAAVRSLAYEQAVRWTEGALDSLSRLRPTRRRDRRMALRYLDVANLRIVTTGYRSGDVRAAYTRARQLGESGGDIVATFRAITGQSTSALFTGEFEDAQARQAELDEIARKRRDLRAMTELMRSSLETARGTFGAVVTAAEEGLRWLPHARPDIPVIMDLRCSLLSQRAAAAAIACDDRHWRDCCDELRAAMPHSPAQDRSSYFLLTLGALIRGEDDVAAQWSRAGLDAATEIGDAEFRTMLSTCLRVIECRAGRIDATELEAAVERQLAAGYAWAGDQFIAWVAESHLAQNDPVAAATALQPALPANHAYAPEVFRVHGDILRQAPKTGVAVRALPGMPSTAAACYERARQLADERGATLFATRARQAKAALRLRA